jgi:hypothetical protein
VDGLDVDGLYVEEEYTLDEQSGNPSGQMKPGQSFGTSGGAGTPRKRSASSGSVPSQTETVDKRERKAKKMALKIYGRPIKIEDLVKHAALLSVRSLWDLYGQEDSDTNLKAAKNNDLRTENAYLCSPLVTSVCAYIMDFKKADDEPEKDSNSRLGYAIADAMSLHVEWLSSFVADTDAMCVEWAGYGIKVDCINKADTPEKGLLNECKVGIATANNDVAQAWFSKMMRIKYVGPEPRGSADDDGDVDGDGKDGEEAGSDVKDEGLAAALLACDVVVKDGDSVELAGETKSDMESLAGQYASDTSLGAAQVFEGTVEEWTAIFIATSRITQYIDENSTAVNTDADLTDFSSAEILIMGINQSMSTEICSSVVHILQNGTRHSNLFVRLMNIMQAKYAKTNGDELPTPELSAQVAQI